jgi:hypothetical protein
MDTFFVNADSKGDGAESPKIAMDTLRQKLKKFAGGENEEARLKPGGTASGSEDSPLPGQKRSWSERNIGHGSNI